MTSTSNHMTPTRRERRGFRAGRLALSVAAVLAIGVSSASAATIPTSLTIDRVQHPARDVFRGKVTAADARCFQTRKVVLFKVAPGADNRLGVDRSEDSGAWSIDVEGGAAAGSYYAKAPAKSVGADTCASAKSPTITVP